MNSLPMEGEQEAQFTRRETREVITPFAFTIDQNLFGTAIASPWKRGVAMLIDLILIAILSSAGGEFLALAIAIAAFRFGSKKRAKKLGKVNGSKRRAVMRFFGALIIFVLLVQLLPPLFNGKNPLDPNDGQSYGEIVTNGSGDPIEAEFDLGKTLEITGFVIKTVTNVKEKGCDQQVACWQEVLAPVPEQVLSINLTQQQAKNLFSEITNELPIKATERQRLASELTASYNELLAQSAKEQEQEQEQEKVPDAVAIDATTTSAAKPISDKSATAEADTGSKTVTVVPEVEIPAGSDNTPAVDDEPSRAGKIKDKATQPIYSIIEFFKALIRDLGLGFGWAAFYFTVCGSLFNGKTPGKKLLGIRVIQLDGTRLSIWDSFGRYGGYGAGLATGLLGFVQIYWDANRQAIQDKISATVVIDERKVAAEELVAMARADINND
ncbi:RDD family protein [Thalassotalea litorea]|uniref:RDD family protein n=1 Tax=Thalassotalea litorea TaxID=2020715 RepID=UPI003735F082